MIEDFVDLHLGFASKLRDSVVIWQHVDNIKDHGDGVQASARTNHFADIYDA
jgi:hypothetical protein